MRSVPNYLEVPKRRVMVICVNTHPKVAASNPAQKGGGHNVEHNHKKRDKYSWSSIHRTGGAQLKISV